MSLRKNRQFSGGALVSNIAIDSLARISRKTEFARPKSHNTPGFDCRAEWAGASVFRQVQPRGQSYASHRGNRLDDCRGVGFAPAEICGFGNDTFGPTKAPLATRSALDAAPRSARLLLFGSGWKASDRALAMVESTSTSQSI